MNLQNTKVGNPGDILKHAALVKLAELLANRNASVPIHYLDTHTYRLTASIPDPEAWKKNVADISKLSPAYGRYIDLEKSALKNGIYHCSTQLVLDVLKTKPYLYLAEKEDNEREEIIQGLKSTPNLPEPIILDDMHKYAELNISRNRGPVLALIDPHHVEEDEWSRIWQNAFSFLKRVHDDSSDGTIIMYKWQKSAKVLWPKPFELWQGPVATISRPTRKNDDHHHLAVYSTPSIQEAVETVLHDLDWTITKELPCKS